LVYYEEFDGVINAIKREKQTKGGYRQDKINLIRSINPKFKDIYENL